MKRISVIVLSFVIILAAVMLSGCAGGTTTLTATTTATSTQVATTTATSTATATATTTAVTTQTLKPKTLTFGIVTPLTSPAANVAMNYERAVQMAMADQNAKGGVTIGGQPYTLSAIVRDDKFDQATAKSLANEMVFNDKVPVIFGPSQVEGPAMQDITNANKVLMFCMSPTPDMCNTKYPYNFFAGGIVSQQYDTVLQYIKQYYPDAKKVVTFYADLPDYPLETGGAKDMCQYYGFDWLGAVKFPTSTTDFSPFAQQLMAKNPDIIDLSGGGGATGSMEGTIVNQIRQAGYTGIIMMPTVPPPGIMNTVPKQYLNKIVTNDINPDGSVVTSEYKDLITRYQQQYGQLPIDFFVQAYNVVSAFFQFLNTQNTMDTQQWMQNFATYKWKGVFGEDAEWVGEPIFGINRAMLTNFWASEWKDGTLATDYAPKLPLELWTSSSGTTATWYPKE